MLLAPLLAEIEEIGDFDFAGRIVKYFSLVDQEFIFVGKYPIREDTFIAKDEIDNADSSSPMAPLQI